MFPPSTVVEDPPATRTSRAGRGWALGSQPGRPSLHSLTPSLRPPTRSSARGRGWDGCVSRGNTLDLHPGVWGGQGRGPATGRHLPRPRTVGGPRVGADPEVGVGSPACGSQGRGNKSQDVSRRTRVRRPRPRHREGVTRKQVEGTEGGAVSRPPPSQDLCPVGMSREGNGRHPGPVRRPGDPGGQTPSPNDRHWTPTTGRPLPRHESRARTIDHTSVTFGGFERNSPHSPRMIGPRLRDTTENSVHRNFPLEGRQGLGRRNL